jgi:hypothetical protein
MRRLLSFSLVLFVLGFLTVPDASAQQSFNFYIGAFQPESLDSRGTNDVLFQNSTFLTTVEGNSNFDMSRFTGVSIGGEYLVGLGNNLEGSLGLGFYQRTVPTFYTDSVNLNGSDIVQDLRLRVVPFTATVRFLPLGHNSGVQPYIGAGVGVFVWRYSETGQFIDSRNNIFVDSFRASGSATGPVVLGGIRIPIGAMGVGGEIRWQNAKSNLPNDQGFAGSEISLGGFNYMFTMNFKF